MSGCAGVVHLFGKAVRLRPGYCHNDLSQYQQFVPPQRPRERSPTVCQLNDAHTRGPRFGIGGRRVLHQVNGQQVGIAMTDLAVLVEWCWPLADSDSLPPVELNAPSLISTWIVMPLLALATTTNLIQDHPDGVPGAIWRGPAPDQPGRCSGCLVVQGRASAATGGKASGPPLRLAGCASKPRPERVLEPSGPCSTGPARSGVVAAWLSKAVRRRQQAGRLPGRRSDWPLREQASPGSAPGSHPARSSTGPARSGVVAAWSSKAVRRRQQAGRLPGRRSDWPAVRASLAPRLLPLRQTGGDMSTIRRLLAR